MSLFLTLYALLGDLDFREGDWTLIGVSLPNHISHPLQKQFPTFLIQDKQVLLQLQSLWQSTPTYQDHCDYQYVLKVYQGCRLRKTLRVHLSCGYITEGTISYHFSEEWLLGFISAFQPVFWGQAWFKEYTALRAAAEEILKECRLYPYEELTPYLYEGGFVIGADSLLPFTADSVAQALIEQVKRVFPQDKAYVHRTWSFVDEKGRWFLRVQVACSEADFWRYGKGLPLAVGWHSHLMEGESVRVILLGISPRQVEEKLQHWQRSLGASLVSPQ